MSVVWERSTLDDHARLVDERDAIEQRFFGVIFSEVTPPHEQMPWDRYIVTVVL